MILRVMTAVPALLVLGLAPVEAHAAARVGSVQAGGLTVEHQVNPLGVDEAKPRLGWTLSAHAHGAEQAAYEIAVSTTRNGRADVWDSGEVRSSRSFDIDYAGPALHSRMRYFWRVRVWDAAHKVSRWSEPAWFETAFLTPDQFHGNWIGSPSKPATTSLTGANWIWYPEGKPAGLGAGRDPVLPARVRPAGRRPDHRGPVRTERRRQLHPLRQRKRDGRLAQSGRALADGDARRHLSRPASRP